MGGCPGDLEHVRPVVPGGPALFFLFASASCPARLRGLGCGLCQLSVAIVALESWSARYVGSQQVSSR